MKIKLPKTEVKATVFYRYDENRFLKNKNQKIENWKYEKFEVKYDMPIFDKPFILKKVLDFLECDLYECGLLSFILENGANVFICTEEWDVSFSETVFKSSYESVFGVE